jgi:hypothetical protein
MKRLVQRELTSARSFEVVLSWGLPSTNSHQVRVKLVLHTSTIVLYCVDSCDNISKTCSIVQGCFYSKRSAVVWTLHNLRRKHRALPKIAESLKSAYRQPTWLESVPLPARAGRAGCWSSIADFHTQNSNHTWHLLRTQIQRHWPCHVRQASLHRAFRGQDKRISFAIPAPLVTLH